MGKLVVTQNPEDHHYVVTNLWFLKAWTFKVRDDNIERGPVFTENLSELICLQDCHNSESVSLMVQEHPRDVPLLHQVH